MKILFKIFFYRYTKIFNIPAGDDFLTTVSEIEMFCYFLLPWPRNYDFCFAGSYTYFVFLAINILKKGHGSLVC